MSKDVLLSGRAKKDYDALPKDIRKRVRQALLELGSGTGHPDVKKLKGVDGREDLFRLRVGDYRVLFHPGKKAIEVIRIDHRSKKGRV